MAAAVNNNLGTLLTNTYATPAVQNQTGLDGGRLCVKESSCAIPTSSTDLAGSMYRFCQVNSNDIVSSLDFGSTALTAGAISLGLYEANSTTLAENTAANVHLFATSIDCSSAVALTNERYANLAKSTIGQRVWQLLGLSADPVKVYDLVGTSTTAATAAGTLICRYLYTR